MKHSQRSTWLENTLVVEDGSLFTVRPNGDLELMGPGWDRRRKHKMANPEPRVARIGNIESARWIAEEIVRLQYGS